MTLVTMGNKNSENYFFSSEAERFIQVWRSGGARSRGGPGDGLLQWQSPKQHRDREQVPVCVRP